MNDNGILFRVLFTLYARKYTTFQRFHWLNDLLNQAGLTKEDVTRVQVVIERSNSLGMGIVIKYAKKTGAPHYLSDIEIENEGMNRVDRLVANTVSDPSSLSLNKEEETKFNEIKNENDIIKKTENLYNFILENRSQFFEVMTF